MAATAVDGAADGVAALALGAHKAAAASHAPFYARRIELFEQFHARQQAAVEAARQAAVPIKIVLPDGSVKEGVKGVTTPLDVAAQISKALAKKVVVAKLDGAKIWDAFRPLEGDCALQLLSFADAEGRETFWHSSAHVLGEALELEFGVDLTIGPALEEGFYYDCYMGDRVRFFFSF
jgi:threonyl-tRNA synthetase